MLIHLNAADILRWRHQTKIGTMPSKTLCLILSVFLFYHDLAVVAINGRKIGEENVPKENVQDSTAKSCNKWEEYDGVGCVCGKSSLCDGEIGMVCDNKGGHYQSNCHFALSMCQGRLSYTREIKTCGHCKWLMVSYSKPHFPTQSVLFQRSGNIKGYDTQYKMLDGNSTIFFERTLNAWAIGIKNRTGTFISMVQEEKVLFPQDSDGGMLVAHRMKGSTEDMKISPYFHMNCVKDSDVGRIKTQQTKFIFSLIAAIVTAVSVTTVATSTALKIVQAKKGCLYYPSVCTLRDEIKYSLKPQVERLRRSFLTKYGDLDKIKENAESIQHLILDTSGALVTIKDLHVQLKTKLSEVTKQLGSLIFDVPDLATELSEYRSWLNATRIEAQLSVIGFEAELIVDVVTLPSIIGSAATALAAGLAIFAGVVAIGFAIADIVSSVKQERELRDRLQRAKLDYVRARENLKRAHFAMVRFQQSFCANVVNYLRRLAYAGRHSNTLFSNLYQRIVSIYGVSDRCIERVYSKTTLTNLRILVSHFKPLLRYILSNVNSLKTKVKNVKEMERIRKVIFESIQLQKKQPLKLFEEVKVYGNQLPISRRMFPNLFNLLRYIAKDILPTTDCYWGHNLKLIRAGESTESNYLNISICRSPEIRDKIQVIEFGVRNITIPCLIFRQVHGNEFRNKYLLLRFIAEHIIPTSNCYWGYNLQALRVNQNAAEIENAVMSSTLFTMLKMFSHPQIIQDTIQKARAYMCSGSLICSRSWQSFILCSVWKNSVDPNVLDCRGNPGPVRDEYCVPPQNRFQECS